MKSLRYLNVICSFINVYIIGFIISIFFGLEEKTNFHFPEIEVFGPGAFFLLNVLLILLITTIGLVKYKETFRNKSFTILFVINIVLLLFFIGYFIYVFYYMSDL